MGRLVGWSPTFPDGEHVVQDLADGHPLIPCHGLAVLVVEVDAVH